ncbi:M15 family metallopeptidase [Nocardioides caricicola]|uniref:M15 family metallopeptidase n=1 Tax=Nocardioides caricicola TaxID=634770 RepID=A0ABW0N8W3_9ACTN
MSLGNRLLLLVSVVALVVGVLGSTASAQVARATPTEVTIGAPAAFAGEQTTLRIGLADPQGAPVAGAAVTVERRAGDTWEVVATVTTDETGRAAQPVTLERRRERNLFRATYAGDADHDPGAAQERVALKRRASVVRLGGPGKVKDGRAVEITVRWVTQGGEPVAGRVKVFRSIAGGRWRLDRVVKTGADGRAAFRTTPRADSRWFARAPRLDWVVGDKSGVHRIDNRPPGVPVKLPAAAPRPRIKLPPQARGTGRGANVRITRIPSRVWRDMTGVSWRQGCPVGRAGLRLVRVNYWDYQGYVRRGEVVAAASAAGPMGAALAEMFEKKLPIRAMYRVDRFGWGHRSRGGDDYASMSAGNTSAFNCRDVTGRPGVRSPHSYGRSLDINTWENPYRSAQGVVPNTWWQSRSHPRVAWRSRSHPVVEVMARHGFRWTYGTGDTQHFDYVGSYSRAAVAPRACDRYCD